MPKFLIHGGKKLRGEVTISGSKNAALPILAATLLTDEPCVIRNVPDIEDIKTLLSLLRGMGSEAEFKNHTVRIQTRRVSTQNIPGELACRMRASVLLLGPLLARTGSARLPYPGGCVLGARPVDTHLAVLRQMGVKSLSGAPEEIYLRGRPKASAVVLPEFSVTATENVLMAAALTQGETQVRLAALEPHVQDLCRFLQKMGVKISGVGSHSLNVHGAKRLRGVSYSITPDYLEAGTFVLAAVLTRGDVVVKNVVPEHLDAVWNLLHEMGVNFEVGRDFVHVRPAKMWKACTRLQTNAFPGFPTDLQPPFAVLLTQAKGVSRIHETLFEGRFAYFPELVKMGAKIEKLNPHEAQITGPVVLLGKEVKSMDIRAGAAIILAALAAKGKTAVSDIQYIDRGYENFDAKLRALGADIVRLP